MDFEARTNKQISTFRYDAEWMESGFAIAPSMPLAAGTFYSSAPSSDPRPALPGAIADCAPDGWGRRLIVGDLGGRPSELDYLLDGSTRLQTGISEPTDIEPSIEAAVEAAPLFDVGKEEAREGVRRMARVVAARWHPLCTAAGMTSVECARYEPAFRRAVGETTKA
ncbi:MAG: HipA N-terminal domain-containing protein [Gammaproteobacteria bacterium]|nr:HipA N-terminal domain-containing protein [Gammaproteobacteria bacterium]